MDCTIYELAGEVLGAFDGYIQKRLRETEWERIQQAVRLQLEFRQELDAIHMLGQPAWTFSIDYSYCNFVDTATGNVPVTPLRNLLIAKLKHILPDHDPDPLNTSTADDCDLLKKLSRLISRLRRRGIVDPTTRRVRRRR